MITATAAVIGVLIGFCALCIGAAIHKRLEAQEQLLKVAVGQGLLADRQPGNSGDRRYAPTIEVFCTSDGGVAIALQDDQASLYTHLSPTKADEVAGLIHERATLQREPEDMAL